MPERPATPHGHTPHGHTLHHLAAHDHAAFVWDNTIAPALEVEPGATISLQCADASGGQLDRDSGTDQVAGMDMARVNPVTGPVSVKGAAPGDVLQIEILELAAHDWGWTAIIPGFGLLADEFPEPWLNIARVDQAAGRVQFLDDVVLPFAPFPGTIGLAPPEPGEHSIVPPRRWGGNLDIRHLTPGATLYLPVGVEGALFSVGDTHAAMGDAEVCGTAVETAMDITVRLSVRRDMSIHFPQFHLPADHAPAHPGGVASSHHVCTGVGPDLFEAARDATRGLVEHITERYGHTRQQAYAIVSVAADLRIHEIVDVPNWVVGAFLPEAIFTSGNAGG